MAAAEVPRNRYDLPLTGILRRFTLYETRHRFYYVGSNQEKTRFRILKIERSHTDLVVVDDEVEYDRKQAQQLLGMINEANKNWGGLTKYSDSCGIVGFTRFLEGYYLVHITAKAQVAQIGAHPVYHIDDMQIVRISSRTDFTSHPDEQRYIYFYFCYCFSLYSSDMSTCFWRPT